MPIITIRYRKIALVLFVILTLLLALVNIRWIGKLLYPMHYKEYIDKHSERYDVDPLLVASIIWVESKYYRYAESPKGARGLMQVAPVTGRWAASEIGINNYTTDSLYDPEINIMIGCWYLDNLNKQFKNNIELVIAAYNGGSGNVTKWLKDERYSKDGKKLDYIPFQETRQYVEKVLKSYKIYKWLYR